MIQRVKNLKLLISSLFIVIAFIILGAVYITYPNLKLNSFRLDSSTADVSVEGSNLKIKFNIINSDLPKAKEFSQNLGSSDKWISGLELSLNPEMAEKAKKLTPVHLRLDISSKKISFKSGLKSLLQSALTSRDIKYATGSSILTVKASDGQNFSLTAQDPKDLLVDATSSGKLQLSPKLDGLFNLSQRVAKIELVVDNKDINGQIELK